MSRLFLITFILFILGGGITLFILFKSSKHNKDSFIPMEDPEEQEEQQNIPYINPTNFDIGIIDQKIYKSSNVCNDTVLKPIIPVNVYYGSSIPDDCPCTKYLQPP
jgi:hypothetical protein